MKPRWFQRGEVHIEECPVCGQATHLPYCYMAATVPDSVEEYDYFEALDASEPSDAA